MSSIRRRAVSSIKWTTVQTIVAGLSGPILLFFKARFLSAEEFGYVSIILIIIGLIQLLEGFGINQAIIQKENVKKEEVSSLFVFNILSSIFWGALLVFFTPFLGQVFTLPLLSEYAPFLFVLTAVNGPFLLFRAVLEKKLMFKVISVIEMSRVLINIGITSCLLFFGYGVYSIIYGHIFGSIVALVSYSIYSLSNGVVELGFCFKFKLITPFLNFGFFVFTKQLLTFFAHRIDELVIGSVLSPEILGVYHFGKDLLEKVRVLLTNSFGKVLLPVFSLVKMDKHVLRETYGKVSHMIAFVAFPLFALIASTSEVFVPFVFGEEWVDSVVVFQVFSISLMFLTLTANVATSLLYSLNRPQIVFYIDLVLNFIYFLVLVFIVRYGMYAVLMTYSLFVVMKSLVLQKFTQMALEEVSFWMYLKELRFPAIFTILVVVFSVFLLKVTTNLIVSYRLLVVYLLCAMLYLSLFYVFSRKTIGYVFYFLEGAKSRK